jgi:hypothetical protein
VIEESGIPTVGIYIKAFRPYAENMKLPRTVVTQHPMGRPMGAPHDAHRHRKVLRTALRLLESAEQGGTIAEVDEPYRTARGRLQS